jgi:hypothetical protein
MKAETCQPFRLLGWDDERVNVQNSASYQFSH